MCERRHGTSDTARCNERAKARCRCSVMFMYCTSGTKIHTKKGTSYDAQNSQHIVLIVDSTIAANTRGPKDSKNGYPTATTGCTATFRKRGGSRLGDGLSSTRNGAASSLEARESVKVTNATYTAWPAQSVLVTPLSPKPLGEGLLSGHSRPSTVNWLELSALRRQWEAKPRSKASGDKEDNNQNTTIRTQRKYTTGWCETQAVLRGP